MSALLCFKPSTSATLRLVCLPHAGAGASSLRALSLALSPAIEAHAYTLPGRAHRAREPSLPTLAAVVDDVVAAIAAGTAAGALPGPIALYGHSFGAVVAFEAARALENSGRGVALVVVAARAAPHVPLPVTSEGASDDELLLHLAAADPSISASHASAELRALMLPTLRTDLRMSERWSRPPGVAVRAPLLALGGRADPSVDTAAIIAWSHHAARFGVAVIDGAHLFHQSHATETAAVVVEHAQRLARGPT